MPQCRKLWGGGGGIIEIAPGSGDLACQLSKHCEFLYTIDPSCISLEFEKTTNHIHISDFFSFDTIQNHVQHKITCIVFRHLLEHIHTPRKFLEDVVRLLSENGIIYVEVPNALEFFHHKRFYEIFNDHCGYYQEASLINVFYELGCEYVESMTLYDNQHIGLFFIKRQHKNEMQTKIMLLSNNTHKDMRISVLQLNKKLSQYSKIALYGAGSHANSLLSFLTQENKINIVCAYDLDTRKHGKYLQKSNIIVRPPQCYKAIECIVIASPLYEQEVIEYLVNSGFCGDIIRSVDCSANHGNE